MRPNVPFRRHLLTLTAIVLGVAMTGAQTLVTAPPNNYTPAQDVELGRQSAAEVERQLPLLRDDAVTSYVEGIGRRLVAVIPSELAHPEFRYSFKVVNVREINAFALPGGPMFVNRGMIEAAHSEGEVVGVMAHELSHVMLRHGTAQASKATKYEVGQVAGALLGAIIGGGLGQVISQGTQFGLGTAFLRFGREYERQADIEGTHLMARAGYDPHEMANMFRTIEKESGSGGPQWLSDHPNPGNRYEYISQEAQLVRVNSPIRDTRAFADTQARLKRLPRAPTTEEATRRGNRPAATSGSVDRWPRGSVEPPSYQYRTYTEGGRFRVSVPDNWRELQDTNVVTFAPEGGYGAVNGRSVFTHGMELGIARNETHDLQSATNELLASLRDSNPSLSRPGGYERITMDGRRALRTTLSNVSDVTGEREMIQVAAAQLPDGTLFYAIGAAPRDGFNDYRSVFDRMISSIRFLE